MLERFKVAEEDRIYVTAETINAATKSIFQALGVPERESSIASDVLISNDLRGIETHGVSNMLRNYVAGYQDGRLTPAPEVVITRETETTLVVDGGGGLGVHIAPDVMDKVIAKAEQYGLGAACVTNVGHMGASGYHAMKAMEHDMIGLAMSTSGSSVTLPTFGAIPRLGTNPIAWAVPANKMPPFVFDVGTSQIARNKFTLAKRVGAKLEPGWVAGADGIPIMEEMDVPDQFGPPWLLPLGGTRENGSHKGYGLGSVVDILGSTLTGIGPGCVALTPGFHLMAYKIDAFVDPEKFKDDMDVFLKGLADTTPAADQERVVYPGLLEAESEEERKISGIPYHIEVIEWFEQIASELGLKYNLRD